jgi:hypothetical protein
MQEYGGKRRNSAAILRKTHGFPAILVWMRSGLYDSILFDIHSNQTYHGNFRGPRVAIIRHIFV